MDIEPLTVDLAPPRYAIESDEEEDEINPLRPSWGDNESTVQVKIIGNVATGKSLVVASGEAGKYWAKGASLGEQTGTVQVNNVQMGLVFNPGWTSATVIVSESSSRLPLFAMHPYADEILSSFKPSSVGLLDTYSVPTYAAETALSVHDPPIRYLSTSDVILPDAQPFSPPNLILSASASFLSILSLNDKTPSTLLLLPNPHIFRPYPKQILPSNVQDSDLEWPSSLIDFSQSLLFSALGQSIDHKWSAPQNKKEKPTRRSTEVGEGGIYI